MPYAALFPEFDSVSKPSVADLYRIGEQSSKAGLMIFGWGFPDFTNLARLPARIERIKVSEAPKLVSLSGVDQLVHLKEFVLTASESGRQIRVATLAPLERLTNLHRLLLGRVRPEDSDLSPITRMTQLKELEFAVDDFTLREYAQLAIALPHVKGRCLQPYYAIKGIEKCPRCGGLTKKFLVGAPPRSPKVVCAVCQARVLAAHVTKWEELVGRKYHDPGGA